MAQVPPNAAKAFDELGALFGGPNSLGTAKLKAAELSTIAKQKLTDVADKFSRSNLGGLRDAVGKDTAPATIVAASANPAWLTPTVIVAAVLAGYYLYKQYERR